MILSSISGMGDAPSDVSKQPEPVVEVDDKDSDLAVASNQTVKKLLHIG